MSRRPDFFIVGAPKCGTTALYHYLRQHPNVYLPDRKEFNYFCTDLSFGNPYFDFSPQTYLAHFGGHHVQRRVGEASVWHLYSRAAPAEIKAFSPHAEIIIMIRDPVEMLHSLYYQLRATGDEDAPDFETALRAEPDRKAGRAIPRNDRRSAPIEGLYYTEVALFSEQIQRYFDVFGRDRVKVIVYDDLKHDPAKVYAAVLSFLSVDREFRTQFEIVNANKIVKSHAVWRFTKFAPPWMRAVWRDVLPAPVRGHILRTVNRLNTRQEPRPPMRVETRKRLLRLFESEVAGLSELLERDLTHWCAEQELAARGN